MEVVEKSKLDSPEKLYTGFLKLEEHCFMVKGRRHRVRLLKLQKGLPSLIEVNGKRTQVEFTDEFRFGSPFSLKIGDKPHRVELNKINTGAPFSITIDEKTYVVKNETLRAVPTPIFKPSLPTPKEKRVRKTVSERGAITAPMPGKIVLLRVKVGDSVRTGTPLCVLEAMKMENEITTPRAGTVKEILVSEGASVNSGDSLFVIE